MSKSVDFTADDIARFRRELTSIRARILRSWAERIPANELLMLQERERWLSRFEPKNENAEASHG